MKLSEIHLVSPVAMSNFRLDMVLSKGGTAVYGGDPDKLMDRYGTTYDVPAGTPVTVRSFSPAIDVDAADFATYGNVFDGGVMYFEADSGTVVATAGLTPSGEATWSTRYTKALPATPAPTPTPTPIGKSAGGLALLIIIILIAASRR